MTKRLVSLSLVVLMTLSAVIGTFAQSPLEDSFLDLGISASDSVSIRDDLVVEEAAAEVFSAEIEEESDFACDSILVIMKHEFSGLNKVFTPEDFGEADILSVEDLSSTTADVTEEDYPNWDEFRQILSLELADKTEEGVAEAIQALDHRSSNDIYYIQPDYLRDCDDIQLNAVPNDPLYAGYQSDYYDLIDLPEAWNITTGSSSVKVGITEKVYRHSDLAANLGSVYDCYTQTTSSVPSYTAGKGTHGTACAGVIGAKGNNGTGFAGVCWDVKIYPLTTTGKDAAGEEDSIFDIVSNVSNFARVVQYLNNQNILIASNSLSFESGSSEAFVQSITNYRGLFVCAAGNDAKKIDNDYTGNDTNNKDKTYCYPASYCLTEPYDNILAVGACTPDDTIASYSNYGAESVDLFAPGSSIGSTSFNKSTGAEIYSIASGTSLAAPMVAGVAALIKSVNPNLSALAIKQIIIDTVDKSGTYSGKCVSGGRLNAYKAVELAKRCDSNGYVINSSNGTIEACYTSNRFIAFSTITIPETVNGYTVRGLGVGAFKEFHLKKINLPSTLRTIGNECFYGCKNLVNVINNSTQLLTVGSSAFANCPKLKSISIPQRTMLIQANAFSGSPNVVLFGPAVKSGETTETYLKSFTDTNTLPFVKVNDEGEIYGYTTRRSAKEILIPSKINGATPGSVGGYAFKGSEKIEKVIIDPGITEIATNAFANCPKLVCISIPTTVTEIAENTFRGVADPVSNAVIYAPVGSYALTFADEFSIMHVKATLTVSSGELVFSLSSTDVRLETLNIPDTIHGRDVVSIDNHGFMSCTNIKTIVLPEGITSIGTAAFNSCKKLTDLYVYNKTLPLNTIMFSSSAIYTIHGYKNSTANDFATRYVLPFLEL